jgi:hypothetical protein
MASSGELCSWFSLEMSEQKAALNNPMMAKDRDKSRKISFQEYIGYRYTIRIERIERGGINQRDSAVESQQ